MSCEKLKRPKVEEEDEDEIETLLMGIMEGYKDSVIPALSELRYVSGSQNSQTGLGKKSRIDRDSDHGRRDPMNRKFAVLQSMVPSLTPNLKASKEKIAVETTKYIRSLKKEVMRLEEMKISRKPTLSGCTSHRKPSVTTTACNDVAFFAVQIAVRQGVLCKLFEVFHKYHAEVFEVAVFVDDQRVLNLTGTFTIRSDGYRVSDVVEKIKEDILVL